MSGFWLSFLEVWGVAQVTFGYIQWLLESSTVRFLAVPVRAGKWLLILKPGDNI